MHFQISSDEERNFGNAFEGDSDHDTEIDQLFSGAQEVEDDEFATDHAVEEILGEVDWVANDIAQEGESGDEEVTGLLPPGEEDGR